ncbi:sulfotransferase [Verrucomicrobiaceae bacterium N1E253]|uniref:Sulfotransferase n=1 Tax=Oceaniferula marina TaxID=2748318 RepID=A0A851GMB0_9BACT|nr:sulfotransferase [Oceaniferula marina]NWK55264.1 sulfotransferase [Oceaniferula marina]
MASVTEKKMKTARQALQSENFRVAASHYRKLVKVYANHPIILLEAVRALTHVGDLKLARQLLKQVEALKLVEFVVPMASGYFKMGDYGEASRILRESWTETQRADVGIALVEVCERMGELTECMEILNQLPAESVRAELLKGVIHSRQGDVDTAQVSFESIVSGKYARVDQGTTLRASLLLAMCYEQQGLYQKAWTTMTGARRDAYPEASVEQVMDAQWQNDLELSNRVYDGFELPSNKSATDGLSPVLVAGHPRSGTSIVAVHLAKELQCIGLDEVGSFMRVLDGGRYLSKNPSSLKLSDKQKIQKQYADQMQLFVPGLSQDQPWLDKNPGMEWWAPYWLSVFPETQIYLVRRHPLDCLLSCMFTYLPLNAFSLQFYTAERAARSIQASLQIQERLIQAAPDVVQVIQYEDFVISHRGKQIEDSSLSLGGSQNSPNYAAAKEKVHSKQVQRYEKYLELLPPHLVDQLTQYV